jgi:hypothetical protein
VERSAEESEAIALLLDPTLWVSAITQPSDRSMFVFYIASNRFLAFAHGVTQIRVGSRAVAILNHGIIKPSVL